MFSSRSTLPHFDIHNAQHTTPFPALQHMQCTTHTHSSLRPTITSIHHDANHPEGQQSPICTLMMMQYKWKCYTASLPNHSHHAVRGNACCTCSACLSKCHFTLISSLIYVLLSFLVTLYFG